MKKVILLTSAGGITPHIAKWLFIGIGISWIFVSILKLTQETVSTFDIVGRPIMILLGVAFTIYGWVAFASSNPYCPRIEIDELGITIRTNFFQPTFIFLWSEIGLININGEKLDLILRNNIEHQFNLRSLGNRSKEIERAILPHLERNGVQFIPH